MAEEEIKEETIDTEDTNTNSPETDQATNSKEEVETQEVEDSEKKENSQKKIPILNKILFGLVGLLLLVLIAGTVLFFTGFFDPIEEPETKEVQKQEKEIQKENSFNIKDINSKKLNKQLLLLTNKNIIEEEEINKREKEEEEKKIKQEEEKKKKEILIQEEEKIAKEKELLEDKRIELQKQKDELEVLKNEAIALRNDMINSKKLLEEMRNEEILKEEMKKEELKPEIKKVDSEVTLETNKKELIENDNKFVSLINVAKIKGELYKSYLDKITIINSDIKLCRDELNRIEIYYGPFEDNIIRNTLYKKLQENGIENSYEVELTKEEFDRRCNY